MSTGRNCGSGGRVGEDLLSLTRFVFMSELYIVCFVCLLHRKIKLKSFGQLS